MHQTAGISFQAAEGGEEDIRLRGFSLAASGDIYVDRLRDPAFYDLAGRLAPGWEVFGSYAWMPVAKIDVGNAEGSTQTGEPIPKEQWRPQGELERRLVDQGWRSAA